MLRHGEVVERFVRRQGDIILQRLEAPFGVGIGFDDRLRAAQDNGARAVAVAIEPLDALAGTEAPVLRFVTILCAAWAARDFG